MRSTVNVENPKYTIAIIVGQLVVGGAEQQLYMWLSHLDRMKFEPIVVTLHPGHGDYWEKIIESMDIPLIRIPRRKNRLLRAFKIARVLLPYKPKLIHGWHLFASPYAGATAKLLGAKSLGSIRNSLQPPHDNSLGVRLTMFLVNGFLTNSRTTSEELKQKRILKGQKIYTVKNAITDQAHNHREMRKNISRTLGINEHGMWIGSIGRLIPGKNFDMLLKILASLKDEWQDFHFILIGDGPERGRLESLARDLRINEFITFAGEIPGASSWISAMDIFCFTSMDEGMPNVALEAAVAGVPVVAWRVPFMEELMGNCRGAFLVEPGDIISFKDKILVLFQSQDLRIKMGKAGRNHVLTEFSINQLVHQMTGVYEELLGIQRKLDPGEL